MSYRSWKKKVTPVTETTLNLQNTSEFPLLGSVKSTRTIQQGDSLAEKLKKTIQAEEELSTTSRYKKSESRSLDLQVLPMPSFIGKLRREREEKLAEIKEEEENYRWQISRSIYPETESSVPYESNSLQTQEVCHYSTQENNAEHDHR
jgi:hypothetical protein